MMVYQLSSILSSYLQEMDISLDIIATMKTSTAAVDPQHLKVEVTD